MTLFDSKAHTNNAVKIAIHISCMLLAAALFELFFVLCLQSFFERISSSQYLLTLIFFSLLNLLILICDVVCFILNRQVVTRVCVTAYVLFLFFAVFLYVLVRTGFFDIIRDQKSFEAFLERFGRWMAVLFVILQFLQVIILPIPSTVTVVAGAALFGPLAGSLLSLLGIVVGSLVAFLVGRYAGHPVVAWLVGKETLDKWLKKIKGKDKLLLSAMFLLPVFPDDVLCFVAGISSMSLPLFLGIITISRVTAIFTTCYSVALIPFDTWWGLLIWAIFIVLVVILFIFLFKKSDKILNWFAKKFHKESRIKEKKTRDEFMLEIVTPNGDLYEKGVKKSEGGEQTKEHFDQD